MGCLRDAHACLLSVGWLKSTAFLLTLGSVYVAALSTFVGIATGTLPTILFKQPLQNPSDAPADLTQSSSYVGTLKLSAASVDTQLNQFSFIYPFVPDDRIKNDADALVRPVKFEIGGQTVVYANLTRSYSIPQRLPNLQAAGSYIMYPFDSYSVDFGVECYHMPRTTWQECGSPPAQLQFSASLP